jgi:uncharacterized protein (DUF1501 family)
VASTTGWLGRWLDATAPDVPDAVRAISLGTGAPALRGLRSLPTVVLDPAAFDVRVPRNAARAAVTTALRATAAPVSPAPWLAAAQAAVPAALDAITVLDKATAPKGASAGAAPKGASAGAAPKGATTDAAKAGSANALLQAAAGIIELGVGTRVLLVGISGFDTHAGQLDRHAALLDDVGRGVAAFFDRLEASGHAGDVLLMTTSEFGRRVAENGSGGCDHGSGGVQFVVGPAVRGARVVGEASLDRLADGDVPIGIDARSLYAVGLDWLGGPTDDLLGGRFDRYGIL